MEKGKNVSVYCGSRYGINPAQTAFAGMAGELLAKNGYTMIYGGGSVGLMGIAADAALAAGGKVVGIIPEVFIAAEQAHRLITELIEVPDLMARKRKMIEAGDAFLILPGGFGTLEEFAELGSYLGNQNLNQQLLSLEQYRSRLHASLLEQQKLKPKYIKLYPVMGGCLGLILCMLMV